MKGNQSILAKNGALTACLKARIACIEEGEKEKEIKYSKKALNLILKMQIYTMT